MLLDDIGDEVPDDQHRDEDLDIGLEVRAADLPEKRLKRSR